MKDTKPSIEERLRKLMLSRSGTERLLMGGSMFEDAKAIALAGLRAGNPHQDEREIRRRMFLRFYGSDFPAAKLGKILNALFGPSNQDA